MNIPVITPLFGAIIKFIYDLFGQNYMLALVIFAVLVKLIGAFNIAVFEHCKECSVERNWCVVPSSLTANESVAVNHFGLCKVVIVLKTVVNTANRIRHSQDALNLVDIVD